MPATGAVDRFAGHLASLRGWRRWAVAFLFGAAAALAQPPFHVVPVLFVSFPAFVWLLDGARTRRSAFVVSWMFGAGYFAAGLYWVSNALLVDAARFAWLIPLAILGLSAGLGLFVGLVGLTARLFWSSGLGRCLAVAAAWTLFEWVRGVVLTGFPWNPIGNVWVTAEPVLQSAAWVGVYGLSAVTVFAAAGLAQLAVPGRRRLVASFCGLAVVGMLAAAGAVRLAGASVDITPGIVLRIVQPNIAQRDKWLPARRAQNFARHLQLSGIHGDGKVTHVIWPETAVPFSVPTEPARRALMRRAVPPGGFLITGTLRFERRAGRIAAVWNSLVAVAADAAVAAVYDKHHLVPFGEYVPFRDILPIQKITAGALNFSAGPGLRTLKLPGLPPFSPLICYEAIFPGNVARRDDRPKWLLNVTNDAWFGTSAGPHQHFASARLRAVEEGLPLVRAANTGISGVIDPYGRIVASLGLGGDGIIDSALPRPLAAPPLFARFGQILPGFIVFFMFLGAVFGRRINAL